jgi:integrase
MRVFVKLHPLAGTNGGALASYLHPFSEVMIRRFFPSIVAALPYKKEIEQAYSVEMPFEEMRVKQLLLLMKEEWPKSNLITKKKFLWEFAEIFGDFRVSEFNEEVIVSWIRHLEQENNYSQGTVFGIKVCVNSFFRFLIEKRVIAESPIKAILKDRINAYKRTILPEEDIAAILSEARRLSPGYIYPMVLMINESAAKTSEVLSLKWKSVNLGRGTITFDSMKRRAPRVHKMSDELQSVLEGLPKSTPYVFTTPDGRPVDKAILKHTLGEFRQKSAHQKKWGLDDLRQSFAYYFLQKGGNPKDLQEILGFRNVNQIRQQYEEFILDQYLPYAKSNPRKKRLSLLTHE